MRTSMFTSSSLFLLGLFVFHSKVGCTKGGRAWDSFKAQSGVMSESTHRQDKNQSISAIIAAKSQEGEVLKKIRLEMIKQDILNKLQMKCRPPPMFFKRRLIPKPVYEGNIYTSEHERDRILMENQMEITQIVVPAEKASVRSRAFGCSGNKICFSIRFSHRLCDNKIINSASLRIFKAKLDHALPLQKLSVYEIGAQGNPSRLVAQKNVLGQVSGWISLDITNLIKLWVERGTNDSSENHLLQIKCDHCYLAVNFETDSDSQVRPYIVISVRDEKRAKRKRRSLDCRPDTSDCCRKLFYVSFAEIGWDDWIIQPLGFDANYCEGSCVGHISPPNAHRSIMQRISNDKNLKTEFSPCCVATDMRSLPLLYFDEEGFIFKRDIPNMTVDSCGCS